jgi:hypothetical protein
VPAAARCPHPDCSNGPERLRSRPLPVVREVPAAIQVREALLAAITQETRTVTDQQSGAPSTKVPGKQLWNQQISKRLCGSNDLLVHLDLVVESLDDVDDRMLDVEGW